MPITQDQCRQLLDDVYSGYGYDFRGYKPDVMERRIQAFMRDVGVSEFDTLREMVADAPACFAKLAGKLTISVTSMFRDYTALRSLRKYVLPVLETYPHIRIWSAGTGSGEEAYSLAIMLREMGLDHRALIYATDLNPVVLKTAYEGRYPLENMAEYTRNYLLAGGQESFADYYSTSARYAWMLPELRQQIVFATHNLATDAVFNEFQLVLCQNVTIYFTPGLTNTVHGLFCDSLCERGFLCLGSGETLDTHGTGRYFERLNYPGNLFRKL